MANTQDATNGYRPVPWSAVRPEKPIHEGGLVADRGLADLALNDNTRWAQTRPMLIMQGCQYDVADYIYWTGSGWSGPVLAWRRRWGLDDRDSVTFWVYACVSTGGVEGQIRVQTLAGATDITVSATTWARYPATVRLDRDANGYGIVWLEMKVTVGPGTLRLRTVSAALAEHSGDLPAKRQTSLFEPTDGTEVDGDSAYSVAIVRRMVDNSDLDLRGQGWSRPVAGYCLWLNPPTPDLTDGNLYTAEVDWQVVCPPIPYLRQQRIEEVRAHFLGLREGSSGQVRLRNMTTGDASTPMDLPSAFDATDSADWRYSTCAVQMLDPGANAGQPWLDWLTVECKGDGVDRAGVFSVNIEEEPADA